MVNAIAESEAVLSDRAGLGYVILALLPGIAVGISAAHEDLLLDLLSVLGVGPLLVGHSMVVLRGLQ